MAAFRPALLAAALAFAAAVTGAGPAAHAQSVASAAPSVRVEFADVGKFTDLGDRRSPDGRTRDAYLEQLRAYVVEKASHALAPGETLVVTIRDVDMAGHFEPLRSGWSDVRVMRDIYPPRIDLEYRLADAQGVVKDGSRRLRNHSYLNGAATRSTDPLRFEKELLDDWVDREIRRPRS